MADNITIHSAGPDVVIAAKDQGGVLHEAAPVETLNAAGTLAFVSPTNPMPVTQDVGTLVQRIEMLELLLNRQMSGAASQIPDSAGRTRVTVDGWTATLSAVGRLNTMGAGNVDAGPMATNMMNLPALMHRARITVV